MPRRRRAATVEKGSELGISVGAFTLYPTLDLNLGYDDNVFATTRRRRPARRSPSFARRSSCGRNGRITRCGCLASGGFGYYASAPTQNFQNYSVQADGRLDIRTDFWRPA